MAGKNILFCGTSIKEITANIDKATTQSFIRSIEKIINPYGDGKSANRAYKLIKEINLKSLIQKVEDPLC
jgi:UDP-N-acetylglucosamine 2-epimerase